MGVDFYEQFDHLAEPFGLTTPEGLVQVFHRLHRDVPQGEPTGCRIPKSMFVAAMRWLKWTDEDTPSPEHMTAKAMRQLLEERVNESNLRFPYVWMGVFCDALMPIAEERQKSDPEAGIKPEHRAKARKS